MEVKTEHCHRQKREALQAPTNDKRQWCEAKGTVREGSEKREFRRVWSIDTQKKTDLERKAWLGYSLHIGISSLLRWVGLKVSGRLCDRGRLEGHDLLVKELFQLLTADVVLVYCKII
jgi:hypothetical protein